MARAARAYGTSYPFPRHAEQNPTDWLAAVRDAIGQVIAHAGISAAEIAAIGVAAQVDGIVAVDDANAPLGPAPIWMDRRALDETAAAEARLDPDQIRALSGANCDASHGGPKIAWLRGHLACRPDAYLPPASFVVAQLTGARTIDPANASSLLLMDIASGRWSEALLAAFELEAEALPVIQPATDIAGTLRPDLAAAWGLPALPVTVGTGDEHAACVAAGVLKPGVIGDIVGTAEPVAAASLEPTADPEGLVETHAHVPGGRWLIEHPGFVSGGSIRWLAEDILAIRQAEVVQLAFDAPPGADGVRFEPALGGASTPRWNAAMLGAFTGLALGHERRHLARAVLEGCALAVRDIVERLDALGVGGDTIRVVGGGARDNASLQLKADITGRSVERLREPEATALGAALVAATAVHWYADLDVAAAATLGVDPRRYEPDPGLTALYDDAWHGHRAVFDALEPLAGGTR